MFQLLQPRFGLRGVRLHLLDRSINVAAPRGCHLRCFVLKFLGRLAPSLHLSSRHVPERCLPVHFPRPPPLAPPTPRRIAPRCSSASQLLWRSLTSHAR